MRHGGGPMRQSWIARSSLIALLLALPALTACGQLPRPFQSEPGTPNELLVLKDRGGIVVAPIAGELPADPERLVRVMAERLKDLNVPATTRGLNGETRVLQGLAERQPRPGRPPEVVISWELWELDGRMVGAYTQRRAFGAPGQTEDDPADGDALIDALAAEAAPKIAALVQAPAEREAAVPGYPGARLVVPPLSEGPGDSRESLPPALRAALAKAGLPLAEREGPEDILVLGRVAVEPAGAGLESVAVVWSVVSLRDGQELGQVDQRNQVPAGSLDGPWGPLAGTVAQGAAAGILDLLKKAAVP